MADKKLKLTLMKSKAGRKPSHVQCVRGLGLRKRHSSVVVADTPENRGLIRQVSYMLRVEEA